MRLITNLRWIKRYVWGGVLVRGSGKGRKTLEKVGRTPRPRELFNMLMESKGWPYKTNKEYYLARDRALVSLLYVGELRVSEAIRIKLGQFEDTEEVLYVHNVQLSKVRGLQYRELRLPKHGERSCFTKLILDYLAIMRAAGKNEEDRLFPWSLKVNKVKVGVYHWKDGKTETPLYSVQMVGTKRAWQIVHALLPNITQHWLRVYGEKYLYQRLGKDIIAVSKIVKVDPRTVAKYLMAGEEEYPVV
jgi:hypothetical protein